MNIRISTIRTCTSTQYEYFCHVVLVLVSMWFIENNSKCNEIIEVAWYQASEIKFIYVMIMIHSWNFGDIDLQDLNTLLGPAVGMEVHHWTMTVAFPVDKLRSWTGPQSRSKGALIALSTSVGMEFITLRLQMSMSHQKY